MKLFEKVKNKLYILKQICVISKSELFDEKYYFDKNPDVGLSGIAPLRHFIL